MAIPLLNSSTGHYYQFVPADEAYPARTEYVTNQFSFAQTASSESSYRGLKGYLATITSAQEHDFVINLVGSTNAYIGGSDRDNAGDWRWISGPEEGSRISDAYSNWYPGEPSNNSFTGDGTWKAGVENALGILNSSGGPWLGRWVDTGEWYETATRNHGYVIEFGGLPQTFQLNSSASQVNEGDTVTFQLLTTNVEWGTSLSYFLSGISTDDLSSGGLGGEVIVAQNGSDGLATISVPISSDSLTEGAETLTVSVQGQSASVTILDTSVSASPNPPTIASYILTARDASVTEGSNAVFNLSTTNVDPGTAVRYILSGVGESDVTGGTLAGTVTIGMDGTAIITVSIREDQETEGLENLYVYVQEESARTSIIDTSKAPVSSGPINITIYDYSYTNDQSIRQTSIGNLVLFEGADSSDIIKGTTGNDRLLGYGGDDRFYSTVGDDVFDGGDGLDAITFEGSWADFVLAQTGSGWAVMDTSSSGTNEGTNTLTGVERLGFADKAVALDIDGNAGKAYRVYKAAFARDPMQGDTGGLGYWIDAIDNGMDMVEVGARFIDSTEFKGLYGTNPQDEEFITSVYRNVLGREPDAGGLEWWLNEMTTNPEKTYAKVLADFAESAENVTGTAQLVGQGIVYDPWTDGGDGGGGGGGG